MDGRVTYIITTFLLYQLLAVVTVSGLRVNVFAKPYPSTVYHIEEDLENPDQLIVSNYGALGIVQKNDNEIHKFVGHDRAGYIEGVASSARFRRITSFHQANATHIIVVDYENHCLRYVNRINFETTAFAGKCQEPGFKDDHISESKFHSPQNVISGMNQSEYYVTDFQNNAVRLIQESEGKVQTIAKSYTALYQPAGLALDHSKQYIYVTVMRGVVKINISSGEIIPVAINTETYIPNQMPLFESAWKIILFSENDTFLIADKANKQLQILDSEGNLTPFECGNVESSCWNSPYSVHLSQDKETLYVGFRYRIYFANMNEESTTTSLTLRIQTTTKTLLTAGSNSVKRLPITIASASGIAAMTPFTDVTQTPSEWTAVLLVLTVLVFVLFAVVAAMLIIKLRNRTREKRQMRPPPYSAPPPPAYHLLKPSDENDLTPYLIPRPYRDMEKNGTLIIGDYTQPLPACKSTHADKFTNNCCDSNLHVYEEVCFQKEDHAKSAPSSNAPQPADDANQE